MTYKSNSKLCGITWVSLLVIIIAGCGGKATRIRSTAGEQFREAMKEYQKKRYLTAIDGFQKMVYTFSGASMIDSAQFYLAMSYFQQEDYIMAAAEFDRVVTTYPGSPFVPSSQYMSGLCLFKSTSKHYGLDQEELLKAISQLEDFVTDYPESSFIADAKATIKIAQDRLAHKRFDCGLSYFRLGYYESAAIYFQMVIDEYTESEWTAPALYYQAETDYKLNKIQEAKTKFSNFLVIYPSHKLAEKARKMLAMLDKDRAESAKKD